VEEEGKISDLAQDQYKNEINYWIGGAFSLSGSFFIGHAGLTPSRRVRYKTAAHIITYTNRSSALLLLQYHVGGKIRPYRGSLARSLWTTTTQRELENLCEILDRVPLPVHLENQLRIMNKFLATRLPAGRKAEDQKERLDHIFCVQEELCRQLQLLKTEARQGM